MKRRGFFSALAKAAVIAVACPVILREAISVPGWRNCGIREMLEQCDFAMFGFGERFHFETFLEENYRIFEKRHQSNGYIAYYAWH